MNSTEVYDKNEELTGSYNFDYLQIDEHGNWTIKVEIENGDL